MSLWPQNLDPVWIVSFCRKILSTHFTITFLPYIHHIATLYFSAKTPKAFHPNGLTGIQFARGDALSI